MKIFVKILFFILIFTPLSATAKPLVAVLSMDSNNVATYSYILKNASAMIAEDTANNFRQGLLFDVKKVLAENLPQKDIVPLQSSYTNAGYVDYDKLDKLNKIIKADYILLLTSYMDIQSHLMDDSIWKVINVAGVDMIDPKYELFTHAVFWNTKDKTVVWEKMYENKMYEKDFNILNPVSTPNYTQINHVKKISSHIAKDMVFRSKFHVFGPETEEEEQEYQRRENKNIFNLKFTKPKKVIPSFSQPQVTNEIKNDYSSGQLKKYDFLENNYNKSLNSCQGEQCRQEVVKCFKVYDCEPKRNFLNLKFNRKLLEE